MRRGVRRAEKPVDNEQLARLIQRRLKKFRRVEIDGLGVFERNDTGRVSLREAQRPRVFIAYASEDFAMAERLFQALEAHKYAPWLDRRKLLPGQNWPRRIEDAISSADFFIACFSSRSVKKRGGFQAEVRYALDCARRRPIDEIFVIPVRLDDCRVPARIQMETQYVDLFPDFDAGARRVVATIELRRREAA
jgi:hypothetical protein